MNPRHLELADEFCKLVGQAHLVEYLGLEPGVLGAEARTSLKKRRKYMQGMQSNPKYKNEALFLIKNFAALDALLQSPTEYLGAVSRRQESAHLPILEMTIRGVLKGGQLTQEQEDYLRRNALELGLSEQTFEDTITRLAAQAGIPLPDGGRGEAEEEAGDPELTDHYGILGVMPNSTRDEVYDAYRARYRAVRSLADREKAERLYKRLDRAWQVLSDPDSRETYNLSLLRTGPPARDREDAEDLFETVRPVPTAPPVRTRESSAPPTPPPGVRAVQPASMPPEARPSPGSLSPEGRVSRLEILGPPVRQLRLGRQQASAEIRVRNTTNEPMPGRVSTDEPWLIANPSRLEPSRKEQVITVRINPRDVPSNRATGVVTVQTDRGDRASIVFEVRKRLWKPALFGVGILAVAGAIGLAGSSLGWFSGVDRTVVIHVDPTSDDVLVDGVSMGSGSLVVIPEAPEGLVTLTVLCTNFETHIQEMDMRGVWGTTLHVPLELKHALDFRPTEDMVQVEVDQDEVQRIMTPRTRGMDDCVRLAAAPGSMLSGKVRIHIGPDGSAIGVDMEGGGTKAPEVRECLMRQAAAVKIRPLRDGDYATVRYDYQVAESTP
ncbi:MAG: DnaJ domain-containing protein [Deltaproteobacteria bacterium]|nr:DnaJ domain-containing protein [Deltaproteobacteria bacterium]